VTIDFASVADFEDDALLSDATDPAAPLAAGVACGCIAAVAAAAGGETPRAADGGDPS
jgi:hypothetical protein